MATSQLQLLSDQKLFMIVEKGRDNGSWLWLSSAKLDQHLKDADHIAAQSTVQCSEKGALGPLHEWTDYYSGDRFNITVTPLGPALSALRVGKQDQTERWDKLRAITPRYSICIQFVQDKLDKAVNPGLRASVDAAYNVIDGVIVIGEVVKPMAPITGVSETLDIRNRPYRWEETYEILFAAWQKLHLPSDKHQDYTGEPLLVKVDNFLDADLSLAANHEIGITLLHIQRMVSWLNWIFVHQRHNEETLQVIRRCLVSRDHPVGHVPNWDLRETYQVGHWGFYALVGTEIGLQISTFLAFNKDSGPSNGSTPVLGNKVIKSITVLQPEDVKELTEQERELYVCHPALLFEITDCNDDLQREKDATESIWRLPQLRPGFLNIDCRRVGLDLSEPWSGMSGLRLS